MTLFGRRVPVWATLVPLVLSVAAYWGYWSHKRDQFRNQLTGVVGPMPVTFGGFPYRLQADLGRATLARERTGSIVRLSADKMTVDRQPWSPNLTVVGAKEPRLLAALTGIGGARLDVEAPRGRASLNGAYGRLDRLSAEFEGARLWLGLVPAMGRAAHLELHVRETPIAPIATPAGPTFPAQAEMVARATGFTLDDGAPLTMEASFAVTAPAPLRSVKGWADQGGTVELKRLVLADAHDTVLDARATAVPLPNGRLEVNGVLMTECPRTVLAAFAHARPPGVEYRARTLIRIPFSGVAGSIAPTVDAAGLPQFTVRAQEAPCPVLRR